MGINTSKKLAEKCSFLSKEEKAIISGSFRLASKNSERIKEEELSKIWTSQIDSRLLVYINTYLFRSEEGAHVIELERFAELFVYCTRGTVDEKLKVILLSLGHKEDSENISYNAIKDYVESVVCSYNKIQKLMTVKQFKSWDSFGMCISANNSQRLAECLVQDLSTGEFLTQKNLESWLGGARILGQLLLYVFNHLYGISHRDKILEPKTAEPSYVEHYDPVLVSLTVAERDRSLVPYCEGIDLFPSYPSRLELNQIIFINSHLPQQYQLQWRFLFSSMVHGESFATLVGRIANQGATVLVCYDNDGYAFGGFASHSWKLNPQYFGDDSCFIFTLTPRMRIFPTTGYNQNFQYLNLHQQTLPNGLGMGGQHEFNGLWLDNDYGSGHSSESCTTFKHYFQLSKKKAFQYRHIEVWAVGRPPSTAEERGERVQVRIGMTGSVLDDNIEGKVMLQMAGKVMYSDDLKKVEDNI